MIKLIAIDLDGTLFNEKFNKNISIKNKEAIKRARKKGCKIVIATGRPIVGVLPVLEQLEMNSNNDYVIVYNGALVYNVGTKEIVHSSTITGEDLKKIYNESKRLNANFHAFTETEDLITDVGNQYTDVECRFNDINYTVVEVNKICNSDKFLKAMIVGDELTLNLAQDNINNVFKENYTMIRSADIFLEFLNINSDKGHALLALAKHLNIDMNDTMAIGDAGNDLLMIKFAKVGVAMANAYNYVKKEADFVTLSNEEDGVAYAIEKYVLKD